MAVRQLKGYVSWVQTVNQNLFLLISLAASDSNIGVKKSTHIGETQPRLQPGREGNTEGTPINIGARRDFLT